MMIMLKRMQYQKKNIVENMFTESKIIDGIGIEPVHIELEDIQDEIDYWNSMIVGYVVGRIHQLR